VQLSGAHSLLREAERGVIVPDACIRPPGAVPEPAFLDRCIRCGLCMKACPTNTLQPAWFAAGPEGMFSPVLTARRAPCEPECNACGLVCPTGALRKLPLEEKKWAKVGTAVVLPGRCLAWAEGKRCVVCEEVCPYGAITNIQTAASAVPAPEVKTSRCYGCGYCEQFCPVRVPAIMVKPFGSLRLKNGSYQEAGRAAGLEIRLAAGNEADREPEALPAGALPPGFTE
jgi:MauM/NapG family ferredoxin protein